MAVEDHQHCGVAKWEDQGQSPGSFPPSLNSIYKLNCALPSWPIGSREEMLKERQEERLVYHGLYLLGGSIRNRGSLDASPISFLCTCLPALLHCEGHRLRELSIPGTPSIVPLSMLLTLLSYVFIRPPCCR